MLYSILTLTGHFKTDELKSFRQWGSPTPGHPELDIMRGIENTSGPLGQGHTNGCGRRNSRKVSCCKVRRAFLRTKYLLSFPTEVSRKRFPREPDDWQDFSVSITLSCSTIQMIFSFRPRPKLLRLRTLQ